MEWKLKSYMYSLMDWYDNLKGRRYFKLKNIRESLDDGYLIKTDQGFNIHIYCREYTYACIYSTKWARNKEMSIYHVYCVCDNHAPQRVKDKFSPELRVSTFLHSWSSKESQKKQAIKVYVDLILKGDI